MYCWKRVYRKYKQSCGGNMNELTKENIQVGKTYRGKRFIKNSFDYTNDRYVVWISADKTKVQYDSDTVKTGRHYPTIEMDKFLKWVKMEVIPEK